jgi:hypothetical protein
VSDIFFGQLSDLWHHLFSLHPVSVFFPHLSVLMHRTWPIALIGWVGVRLLIRSTGRVLHLGSDLLSFGVFWLCTMFLYVQLGLGGSAIVHGLAFFFLILGCVVRIIATAASASHHRRYRRN